MICSIMEISMVVFTKPCLKGELRKNSHEIRYLKYGLDIWEHDLLGYN